MAIEYVTLDNVMETPVWTQPYFSEEVGHLQDRHIQDRHLQAADLLLLGRITYDGMSGAWPKAEDDEGGFARRINTLPKEVVTSRKGDLNWNATPLAPDDLLKRVRELRQQGGANILIYGSGQVVRPLLDAGLLDELHLLLCPLSVGQGKKLFDGNVKLKPTKTETFSQGMTLLTFEPASD
ncbi:dihydrofolate reductase family protein [Deinococcus antarcticus]|uniref:Dihydrofolate reductase family protein n=1 Tax=Deinococcus antarcticus TaxID=1298767 RepID=A0ABV8ABU8_9DEIO